MVIVSKAKERYRELDKRFPKGVIESIYNTPMYLKLIKKMIMFRTSDNLYFVKNINRKDLTYYMFYENEEDMPNVTLETFTDYHFKRNPNLKISSEYWLYRVVNEENDKLTYTVLKDTNEGNFIRKLTDKETAMVNQVVQKAIDYFKSKINKYWNEYKYFITCYCYKDLNKEEFKLGEKFDKRKVID